MTYVESQLLPGEKIKYRAHLHRIGFLIPYLICAVAIGGAIATGMAEQWIVTAALAAAAIASFLWTYIVYSSSEFAVTDRRVIIKVGWIQRRTLETMLNKVEGISIDQSVMGRLFSYGSITITGTGGTREEFKRIAHPLELRKQIHSQIVASDDRDPRGHLADSREPVAHTVAASGRIERDCPFCAEPILARAKACKHCGRDVAPTSA